VLYKSVFPPSYSEGEILGLSAIHVSQGFFAIRVYRLSNKIWYTLFSWALSCVKIAAGIGMFVVIQPLTIPEFCEKYLWFIAATITAGAIVDICNTVELCYCLIVAKSDAVLLPQRCGFTLSLVLNEFLC